MSMHASQRSMNSNAIDNTPMPTSAPTAPSQRLQQLGITLPTGIGPAANYVPATCRDGVMYLSGQIPRVGAEIAVVGAVGRDVDLASARGAARICAIRLLAVIQDMHGSLDVVEQVSELTVYVRSAPDFDEPSAVADAASDVFVQVFGEKGRHARTAVGVAQLPKGAAVEISARVIVRSQQILGHS